MNDKPSVHRKFFKYITPQRSYDITTITAALICCSVIFRELFSDISNDNNIYGILFFCLLGALFPLVIWKIKKRVVVFNGKHSINIDSLVFLPLAALSEEVIWRFCLPFLLLYLLDSLTLSILISSIGFIILHLPLGGFKSIAYMSLFTILVVLSFLAFGILASIAFHITHNLAIQFFRPVRKKTFKTKNPTLSQTEW
ncbi:CPBP family intramembrane glutamic endopeptidase [Bacillus sp. WLY-B-L8]|uniref:CPBP family intramembrane glutamic endopeptidase n=1 Tax=Bacillus multifaciens TaxID=3068506 RepID=UPI002742477D|nr:CPBP family intramembrane glutamic endopeptidase [Bacillus sp. WLY-B-L8]MDP7980319.1 CPBP family intramembrane metalloprotease [Bacillus sp. WLY-B-L8]